MTKAPDFQNVYGSLVCLIEMLALCHTMQDSCALAISADAVNSALGSLQGCLQRYYSQLDEDERKKLQQLTPCRAILPALFRTADNAAKSEPSVETDVGQP